MKTNTFIAGSWLQSRHCGTFRTNSPTLQPHPQDTDSPKDIPPEWGTWIHITVLYKNWYLSRLGSNILSIFISAWTRCQIGKQWKGNHMFDPNTVAQPSLVQFLPRPPTDFRCFAEESGQFVCFVSNTMQCVFNKPTTTSQRPERRA